MKGTAAVLPRKWGGNLGGAVPQREINFFMSVSGWLSIYFGSVGFEVKPSIKSPRLSNCRSQHTRAASSLCTLSSTHNCSLFICRTTWSKFPRGGTLLILIKPLSLSTIGVYITRRKCNRFYANRTAIRKATSRESSQNVLQSTTPVLHQPQQVLWEDMT